MTTTEKMIHRAFAIGQEMLNAGDPGYMFLIHMKTGGEPIHDAFEHYTDGQGYLESLNNDQPVLVPVDQILTIRVVAV